MKTLAVSWMLYVLVAATVAEDRPPAIHTEPDYEVYFRPLENVELPCVADGVPAPVYSWTRNDILFNPDGNDDSLIMRPGVGSLVFLKPEDKDEGVYQCFARNDLGTSASKTVKLKAAKLEDIPAETPRTHRPILGRPYTLPCVIPESVPEAQAFWGFHDPSTGDLQAVSYDQRVTIDKEYRLRFAHVKLSDYQHGLAYRCVVMNSFLRRIVLGPSHYIQPMGTTEESNPVSYMWSDPNDIYGIKGETFSLKCIFSGNPTPDIHWRRTDNGSNTTVLPDRAQITSYGQELEISDLRFEDAGTYECRATNPMSPSFATRTFNLRVVAKPYFTQEPVNLETTVGTDAEFTCEANGVPPPFVDWYVNGIPLSDVTDPRITGSRFTHPEPGKVVLHNVEASDSMVLQCNASNYLGYAYADFYFNVVNGPDQVIVG